MGVFDWLFGWLFERKSAGRVVPPAGWTSEERRVVVATPDGDTEKEITYYRNRIGMEFVLIPAGKFRMGSPKGEKKRTPDEGPVHGVRIARPFFLGATPVTQATYEQLVGSNPSKFRGPNRPIDSVSWHDAQESVRRLCETEGVPPGAYRLPTEAEWEYACRAGSRTDFYSGDRETTPDRIAWYTDNSGGETHEVGQKLPNAFGLYDMSGNVDEWSQSLCSAYPYSESDGREDPSSDGLRVLRGGAWDYHGWGCRSAGRHSYIPAFAPTSPDIGFRVAASSPPQE